MLAGLPMDAESRRHGRALAALCLLLLLGDLLVPAEARAYLDPGSASLFFQGLVASVLAAGLVLKTYWRRILARLGLASETEEEGEDEARREDDAA